MKEGVSLLCLIGGVAIAVLVVMVLVYNDINRIVENHRDSHLYGNDNFHLDTKILQEKHMV